MGTDVSKKKFVFKDVLAVTLSICAFLLSLINFYYVNYRIEDNLQARITDKRILYTNHLGDSAVIQVAFINAGNRQAIVLSPMLQVSVEDESWSIETADNNNFPFILQPREMKIVDLKTSAQNLTVNAGKVVASDTSVYEYKLGVEYFSLDSKGVSHDVFGDFNIEVIANDSLIQSIKELDNLNRYPATNLFKDKGGTKTNKL